jgi:hypothetical protein
MTVPEQLLLPAQLTSRLTDPFLATASDVFARLAL